VQRRGPEGLPCHRQQVPWDPLRIPALILELLAVKQPPQREVAVASSADDLMHKTAEKADRSAESLKFFQWAYKNGQKLAIDLDYVPIPAPVVSQIEATFAEIKDAAGKPVLAK
jgi:phosphate transport system substrate-binding protein